MTLYENFQNYVTRIFVKNCQKHLTILQIFAFFANLTPQKTSKFEFDLTKFGGARLLCIARFAVRQEGRY